MKRMMLLVLVLVCITGLLAGCRWMTDDTTDNGDNSSVGDSTAGSTPVPTATVPTVTTPSTNATNPSTT